MVLYYTLKIVSCFRSNPPYLPSSLTFSSDRIANGWNSLIAFEYILLSRHDAFNKAFQIYRYFGRAFMRQLLDTLYFFFFEAKNIRNFTGRNTQAFFTGKRVGSVLRYPRNIWRRCNGKCPISSYSYFRKKCGNKVVF